MAISCYQQTGKKTTAKPKQVLTNIKNITKKAAKQLKNQQQQKNVAESSDEDDVSNNNNNMTDPKTDYICPHCMHMSPLLLREFWHCRKHHWVCVFTHPIFFCRHPNYTVYEANEESLHFHELKCPWKRNEIARLTKSTKIIRIGQTKDFEFVLQLVSTGHEYIANQFNPSNDLACTCMLRRNKLV